MGDLHRYAVRKDGKRRRRGRRWNQKVQLGDCHPHALYEVSGQAARQKVHFDESLFATNGNVIFAQNEDMSKESGFS
jgi:hypothetical protein